MNLDLAGKVALVTGSSRGIGKAIAHAFTAEGCKVALNGRNEDSLMSAATEIGGDVFIALGDVSLPEAARNVVSSVVRHFGRLDIVVANHQAVWFKPCEREDFNKLLKRHPILQT